MRMPAPRATPRSQVAPPRPASRSCTVHAPLAAHSAWLAAVPAHGLTAGQPPPQLYPLTCCRPCSARCAGAAGDKPEGVVVRPSLDSALDMLSSAEFEQRVETVFVIGGGQVLPASPVERTAVCRTGCALMNAAPHCWRIWRALMNAAPNCRLKAVVPAVRRLGCNRPCRPRAPCVCRCTRSAWRARCCLPSTSHRCALWRGRLVVGRGELGGHRGVWLNPRPGHRLAGE